MVCCGFGTKSWSVPKLDDVSTLSSFLAQKSIRDSPFSWRVGSLNFCFTPGISTAPIRALKSPSSINLSLLIMSEYEQIRKMCLKRGELWEDPDFPANQASVFYHQTPPFQFTWKRPKV
ncbi:hypothetical protein HUJ04_008280 [Dendroctonus ponderosae]|nr:hypothetical protein HUJ04_008280 [Dendroctonus ponderosae]